MVKYTDPDAGGEILVTFVMMYGACDTSSLVSCMITKSGKAIELIMNQPSPLIDPNLIVKLEPDYGSDHPRNKAHSLAVRLQIWGWKDPFENGHSTSFQGQRQLFHRRWWSW